ncbi:MAG: RNA methyltransferase [Syntrophomonadaceae bacterium]
MPTPLHLVLVRPQKASNLGSVARVAKNFGIERLRAVDPAVPPDEESSRLAAGADDLLASIERHPDLSSAVADLPVVVATSSMRGRGRAPSLSLSELSGYLAAQAGSPAAFVFGPERSGLTEDELARATACLRLPTDPAFPTMNLSHAVAVVLAVARGLGPQPVTGPAAPEPLARSAEIEAALAHWDRALEAIDFYDTGHRDRSLRDWRGIVAARPLTVREVAMLRGVANRILVALELSRKP